MSVLVATALTCVVPPAALFSQGPGGPLKTAVSVVVLNPAIAVPAGWTVFHGAKGIETPGFDVGEMLATDFIAAMADDKRFQCQSLDSFASSSDTETAGAQTKLPPGDADRSLQIVVETIQAIKIKFTGRTEFTMAGSVNLTDKTGVVIWRSTFKDSVMVKGEMKDYLKDNQSGLKAALNRLVEQVVAKRSAEVKKRKKV